MIDYTISHPCGLEEYETNWQRAMKAARIHKMLCPINESEQVFVDKSEDMELTDTYWKV